MAFEASSIRRASLLTACFVLTAACPFAALLSAGPACAQNVDERYSNTPPKAEEPEAAAEAPEAEPEAEAPAPDKTRRSRAKASPVAISPPTPPRRPVDLSAPRPTMTQPAGGAPALTIRSADAMADPLQAALTTRDILRRDKRAAVVLAAPTSLADRPAPARPSDKVAVEEPDFESKPHPFAVRPKEPDAPTSGDEADILVKQTERVVTDCFPSDLKTVIARMTRHFGSPVIVTSGYRSGGRRGSLHRSCRAADVQIAGVRPSQIIAFAQQQNEIGGIGSYRHTRSIHIDVREQKMSWYGSRGRGWFRVAKETASAVAPSAISPTWQMRGGEGGHSGGPGGGPEGGGPGGGAMR